MNRQYSGVTLVEAMISFSVFMAALIVGVGVFISVLDLQEKGRSARDSQQTGRQVLESISRDIRSASFVSVSADNETISFENSHETGAKVTYELDGGDIKKETCNNYTDCTTATVNTADLTVDELEFRKFNQGGQDFIEVYLKIRHGEAGLTESDERYFDYELKTIVTMRQ